MKKNKFSLDGIEEKSENIALILVGVISVIQNWLPFNLNWNYIYPITIIIIFKRIIKELKKNQIGNNTEVGYLSKVLDECLSNVKSCKEIKFMTYDSKGFFHIVSGYKFKCKKVKLIIHEDTASDKEIVERWKKLYERLNWDELEIRSSNINKIFFGMSIDGKGGVLGYFKPEYLISRTKILSTMNTYQVSKNSIAGCELLNDFEHWFDIIFSDEKLSKRVFCLRR